MKQILYSVFCILNQKKTNVMIFNFTDKYKFTANLKLNDEKLEVVNQENSWVKL